MKKTTIEDRPASIRGKGSAKLGVQHRMFEVDLSTLDLEARTIEVAFSSEDPAHRWWGEEILDHTAASVRMERLQNGAPMLWQHHANDQRGVVEEARIDSDRVGRALLRFGRNPDAEELLIDVKDGVKSKISVGYLVHRMVLQEETDEGPDQYRVTDWEPLEISFVSIAMDDSVGVGKSADDLDATETKIETKTQPTAEPPKPVKIMTPKTAEPKGLSEEEMAVIRKQAAGDARSQELARIKEIEALGDQHKKQAIARDFIGSGKSVDEFKSKLLEEVGTPVATKDPGLGMDPKQVKQFSIHKLLRAIASPNSLAAQEEAAFEIEASDAMDQRSGKRSRGRTLPPDVLMGRQAQAAQQGTFIAEQFGRLQRALTAGGNAGNLVGDRLDGGNFIELLRNVGRALRECTILTPDPGDFTLPRHSGSATRYWTAEAANAPESAPTFDQLTFSPKTVSANLDISRKLMMNSSIEMEGFTLGELAMEVGLGLDDAVMNGTGINDQPLGILNTPGIGDVAGGANGSAIVWADLSNLKREVNKDNALAGDAMWLINADTVAKLEQTEKSATTGIFLLDPDRAERRMTGYRWEETNQMLNNITKGTGTNLSAILFGVMRQCFVPLWGGLDINIDTASLSRSGGVRFVVHQDADIGLRHVAAFAAKQDIITV